jgi:hypothetical protein
MCWVNLNIFIISILKIILITIGIDHISQHEYVNVVQLLGLLGDKLIDNGVLLQEIGPHLNLHHPNALVSLLLLGSLFFLHIYVTFQFYPCYNVRFVVHLL